MRTAFEADMFPSTHWSAISKARGNDSAAAKAALDRLCVTYWKPVYRFIRHLGQTEEDAEDLTQDFFRQQMVRRNLFLEARKEKGSLRKYVCVAVKRLVYDANKKRQRLKRGGDQSFVSFEAAEEIDEALLDSTASPDRYFDRQWAIATIGRVVTEFEADLVARGKEALFAELRPYLMGPETDTPQQEVAQRLGMEPNALSNLLQRWRSKLGKAFRAEVAATIPNENPREIEAEIVYLRGLFGSGGNS